MKKKCITSIKFGFLVVLAVLMLFASCHTETNTPETPAEDGFNGDYSSYDKGVTVVADSTSPTGYTAIFVYEEEASYDGLTGEVVKVELYSDCMLLFDEGTPGRAESIDNYVSYAYDPDEYYAGLYPAGGTTASRYTVALEEFEDGLWGVTIPLSSGAFVYNFTVYDSSDNSVSRLDDPNNPTLRNTATGISSLSSMVYIPYNASKMGSGDFVDRSVELPRSDRRTGSVETIAYVGADNDLRGLAVYLPYGYSASRSEPYKVLYLSHGASGDSVGNELRWMNEGAVKNIMDNLIAEGKIEPFVIVTMNNQDLGWSYSSIWAEQVIIMEEIERRYNVATTAEGRAFAGLSMGGLTTNNMYINHYDDFSYFGIWSYANPSGTSTAEATLADLEGKNFLLACGSWDSLISYVDRLADIFDDWGVEYDYLEVPAAHDWEAWQLIFAYAAENFFWK